MIVLIVSEEDGRIQTFFLILQGSGSKSVIPLKSNTLNFNFISIFILFSNLFINSNHFRKYFKFIIQNFFYK